ncbi:uncharacterized protein A1O5_07978 [Cladophialophora psammophila CBS 110553]|uniref:Uncharacterized protein n=1 Tax=Cladophialophora psammophila CBS 110553 TaxID=1182543 RepID=W9WMD7_9EURO|nr:uncharacterized protein A1O5_07978 [Cladophialophora psammophila CBS 110553]EXJ69043.1 hypothetical protein A1O5_07978 [Cladophialophora psammophila CBS 110553]
MLPVEGMVDTQLQDQYVMLCKTVEYCLDSHFGDAESMIASLSKVGLSESRRNLVSDHLPERLVLLADGNRNLEIPMMQGLVCCYLYEKLLRTERIFPGLDQATEACLGMIIDGMNFLKPAKDQTAVQMWRVDLQRTLHADEQSKRLRENELREIEATIMRCLQLLKGTGLRVRSRDLSLCSRFVQEAGSLAENIRESMAEYELDYNYGPLVINEERFKDFTIVDSRTGCPLRSTAVPVAGPSRRVGEVLFTVYLAFVRKSSDSSKKIVLVKSTMVVEFGHPVPRGRKSHSSHGMTEVVESPWIL